MPMDWTDREDRYMAEYRGEAPWDRPADPQGRLDEPEPPEGGEGGEYTPDEAREQCRVEAAAVLADAIAAAAEAPGPPALDWTRTGEAILLHYISRALWRARRGA